MEAEFTDNDSHVQERRRRDSTKERERREKTHPTTNSTISLSKNRSVSPSYRSHKRVSSGPQQGSGEITQPKTKKSQRPWSIVTAVKVLEDRMSVSSSASASPMPSARLGDSHLKAPMLLRPSLQIRKSSGIRTVVRCLARACAAQEYEVAVARHAERPEDLNVADNAEILRFRLLPLEGCAPIVKFLLVCRMRD